MPPTLYRISESETVQLPSTTANAPPLIPALFFRICEPVTVIVLCVLRYAAPPMPRATFSTIVTPLSWAVLPFRKIPAPFVIALFLLIVPPVMTRVPIFI